MPTTRNDGEPLSGTSLEADFQEARDYAHGPIIVTDFDNAQFIEPKHIRPPTTYTHRHGFSTVGTSFQVHKVGFFGADDGYQAASNYNTGQGQQFPEPGRIWRKIANSTVNLIIPKDAIIHIHWQAEFEAGPDMANNDAETKKLDKEDRRVYVGPYVGSDLSLMKTSTQPVSQNVSGFSVTPVVGPTDPYCFSGYGSRSGHEVIERSLGTYEIGLVTTCTLDRALIISCSVVIIVSYV
jgi:hypothetical protein